jgi:succinyl-diaminopimelate desuccinylase
MTARATDLLALTAELVDIPSVSHDERAITDHLERQLAAISGLEVVRIGDNLVARTFLGRGQRVVIAGHTDTVPPNSNERARVDGDRLFGLGACDMKGGVAVMLDLARTVRDPAVDVTWVFYACEEVAAGFNGLGHLFRDRPDLVAGDVAILGEPTGAVIEAGCQGTLRAEVDFHGVRAHSARPWMGRNAIHRAGALLRTLEEYVERRPVLDGCEYREAVQAVLIDGGVAANVVPDRCRVTVNHRFAPDRSPAAAEAHLRELVAPHVDSGDDVTVVDAAAGAAPGLDHPVLAALISRNALPVRAKLGWTDVARFAAHGIPAANFGPGDPTIAHSQDEHVTRRDLEVCQGALRDLLVNGVAVRPGAAGA